MVSQGLTHGVPRRCGRPPSQTDSLKARPRLGIGPRIQRALGKTVSIR